MKILSLYINGYKNLNNFKIDLDESEEDLHVLIGENGSGKSNLLEAIVIIFRNLMSHTFVELSFDYKIKYQVDNKIIEFSFIDDVLKFKYEGEEKDFSEIETLKAMGREIYPDNVFLYYNGTNERLKELLTKIEDDFVKELKSGSYVRRPIFYMNPSHFKYALASFVLDEKNRIEVLKNIHLEEYDIRFEFRLKKEIMTSEVADIILFRDSLGCTVDNLKFNLKLNEMKEKLIGENEGEVFFRRDIFKVFDMLNKLSYFTSKGDMDIVFYKGENEISYEVISEGQKQKILLEIIYSFFNEKETLYLLDEPDVFLHPKWQRDIPGTVESFLKNAHIKNQTFITTHSPLLLGEAKSTLIMEAGKCVDELLSQYKKSTANILEEVMGVTRYSSEIIEFEQNIYKNLFEENLIKAQEEFDNLKSTLSSKNVNVDDHELILEIGGYLKKLELLDEVMDEEY